MMKKVVVGAAALMMLASAYAYAQQPPGGRDGGRRWQPRAEDRAAFLDMVAASWRAMRTGLFPITPEDGEYGVCSRCPFPLVCRKSHGPSRIRAASLDAKAA